MNKLIEIKNLKKHFSSKQRLNNKSEIKEVKQQIENIYNKGKLDNIDFIETYNLYLEGELIGYDNITSIIKSNRLIFDKYYDLLLKHKALKSNKYNLIRNKTPRYKELLSERKDTKTKYISRIYEQKAKIKDIKKLDLPKFDALKNNLHTYKRNQTKDYLDIKNKYDKLLQYKLKHSRELKLQIKLSENKEIIANIHNELRLHINNCNADLNSLHSMLEKINFTNQEKYAQHRKKLKIEKSRLYKSTLLTHKRQLQSIKKKYSTALNKVNNALQHSNEEINLKIKKFDDMLEDVKQEINDLLQTNSIIHFLNFKIKHTDYDPRLKKKFTFIKYLYNIGNIKNTELCSLFSKYKSLKKSHNQKLTVKAVDGVDLDIYEGETLGMVGESGCGKSTFGRTVLKLYDITDGEVQYKGEKLTKLKGRKLRKVRKDIQIIFQDPYSSLNPRMTVGSIISEALIEHKLYKKGSQQLEEYVKHIMKKCGLDDYMIHRYPHEFSGGQRQRIGIARALALQPKFIVCDEAVSALDVSIQSQIINLLKELQNEFNFSYLFISHDLSVVKHISDRICVMYLGKVVEITSKQELFNNPSHPYTQALLSAIPSTDIDAKSFKEKQILEGDIPSNVIKPIGCSFNTRCPKATKKCFELEPELVEIRDNHMCSCHNI